MEILEILNKNCINLNLEARTKNEVFEEMVGMLIDAQLIENKKEVLAAIKEREKLMSTGIGNGVAIPHAKCASVTKLVAAFGRAKNGINYQSLDDEPVYLIFLLLTPENEVGSHVKALARFSRLLKHKYFRQSLMEAKDPAQVVEIIRDEERQI